MGGLIGGVFPDIDLAYFYLVDNRQTHHHKYFMHWPIVWLGLLALALSYRQLSRRSVAGLAWAIFASAGLLHLLLDSLVGDIWWFAPFIDKAYAAFTVPAPYQPWWLNFVLHWSFAVEIFICVFALLVYRQRSTASRCRLDAQTFLPDAESRNPP